MQEVRINKNITKNRIKSDVKISILCAMHHLLMQIRMLRKQRILSLKNIFRLGLQSLCLSSWQGKGKECDNSKIHMTKPFTIKTHSEYILYLLLNTQVSRFNV